MKNIVGKVYFFFDAHPKRQTKLDNSIAETQLSSNVTKLKDLCHTQWVQRLDAFTVFSDLYQSVLSVWRLSVMKVWDCGQVTPSQTLPP